MKGYSTKYCLTRGIMEVEIEEGMHTPDGSWVYTKRETNGCSTQLKAGVTFFTTREEAEEAMRKMAEAKVRSLQGQLEKMRRLAHG